MTLSDDGTESFSFTIPMHLWVQDGDVTVKKENPIWYTVRDGVLMVNMRKIKVIFNKTFGSAEQKQAAGERVFEFLITKITESHEEDNPTCQVECEGLAFHELGKQGYKIELSSDVFYDRDNTYYNGDTDGSMIWYDNLHQPHANCPRATVDYWMNDLGIKHARYNYKTVDVQQPKRVSKEEYTNNKNNSNYFYVGEIESTRKYYKYEPVNCINGLDLESTRTNLNPTEWYYDVQMDWSAYSDVDKYDIETSTRAKRETDKVYEEPYVSSWDKNLNPKLIEPAREKERLIDANESNLYNLTQTIAENFEIFCRYEYSYDSRYQITGRKIIFYNTFHADYNNNYFEHLNYPHSTSSVSREYDGTEITTKMYVRPETDDSSVTGQISIIDSGANPTKEDYVMNFDYLHDIGTISDEQYGEIKNYNLKMKYYNEGEIVGTGFDTTGAIALQDGYYRKGDRIYIQKNGQWEVAGLITLQEQLLAKQDRKIEVDAKLTVANNSASEALERLNDASSHIGSGASPAKNIQQRKPEAPQVESIVKYKDPNGNEYYQLSLTDSGIFPDSIKMYKKWTETTKTFSDYTSDITDIPDSEVKELFTAENLDFENSKVIKAVQHYMRAAGLEDNDANIEAAQNTLNSWYQKLRAGESFNNKEIPAFVNAKVSQKTRANAYGNDCSLKNDAIGWVLHALGKASYKKLDANNWKTYVLQVKSPAGKEYFLKSLSSSKKDEKCYINKITWNEWVACRLEWCLAVQKGILIKDIQMKKTDGGNSYTITSKLSWAKLRSENDSLTVSVNDKNGKVTWTADFSALDWGGSKTADTFRKLNKNLGKHQNYYDLLKCVGIWHYPNQITSFEVVKNSEGNPTGIRRIPINKDEETLTKVYLIYDFDPITYYRNIRLMWEKKLLAVQTDQKLLSDEQFQLETSIVNLKEVIRAMLKDKFADTRKFDHLMGPAMRESYWQPEDYHDYGDYYSQRLNAIFFNNRNTEQPTWRDEQISAGFFWDSELFPEEEKGYYYLGVDTGETAKKHFYPCIDLFSFFKSHDETPASNSIIINGVSINLQDNTEAVTDDMIPVINETTDEMIPDLNNDIHQYAPITNSTTAYNIVGSGILTATATGNSYIAGTKKIPLDESQGWKIPATVTGVPIESALTNITGQSSSVNNTEVITNIAITDDEDDDSSTFEFINTFVQNFDKLAFSYYNDNFDKQVQTSKAYNVATQDYQINSLEDFNKIALGTKDIEYRYDQSLFAAVKEDTDKNPYVQWYYKTKSIETMEVTKDETSSGEAETATNFVYNDVEVSRSEADRVFYSIGSRTANGVFVENDEVKLMFLRKTKDGTSTIIPVLMFKGLDSAPNSLLHYIQQPINYDEEDFIKKHNNDDDRNKLYHIHPGAQPAIGFYNYDGTTKFKKIGYVQPKHWINFSEDGCTYEVVYPRIKINSLQLKPSSVSLSLNYDLLTQYEDYYIFTRKTDHLITIKPHIFFEMHGSTTAIQKKRVEEGESISNDFVPGPSRMDYYLLATRTDDNNAKHEGYLMGINSYVGSWLGNQALEIENLQVPTMAVTNYIDEMNVVGDLGFFASVQDKIMRPLRITYAISNGGTRTYLDALKVIKENSQPKVAYNVTPNIANSKLVGTLYNRLGQIVGINDAELKFKNVFGYISSIELDLDHPWEDSVEVKNYTNKFEDLFSSITAQTEAMKKSSGMMAGFASGNMPMALDQSIANTVTETINTPANLSNLMEAFDGPAVVQEALYSIFDEANTILDSGREGINELLNLNSQNAQIFSTFIKNIRAQTTPAVFTGDPTKITGFKAGDICYGEDGRTYIAASGDAFMPMYDGTVSKIVGASVEWDANLGTVNIEGATQIDIRSGNNIDIAADSDVNIIGNKSVNIGGATINIGSAVFETTDDEGNVVKEPVVGGINIVSSRVIDTSNPDEDDEETNGEEGTDSEENSGSLSGVFINPEQISLLSSNIIMEGAEKIQMYTSGNTPETTSAFQISATEGIWMGSGKGIEIYANGSFFNYDSDNQTLAREWDEPAYTDEETGVTVPAQHISNINGASVSIQPERILMGVANTNAQGASIVRIKSNEVMIASSNLYNVTNEIDGTSNGLIGAKFTPTSIGLAVQNGNDISAFLMNDQGITIGGGINLKQTTAELKENANGSYVRIEKTGITLGSMANLYVNMPNFKVKDGNVWVQGEIYATTGNFSGSLSIGSKIIEGLTYPNFSVDNNGILKIGPINSTSYNILMDPTATGVNPLFRIGQHSINVSEDKYIEYLANGALNISGTINAQSGKIGNWTINEGLVGNVIVDTTDIMGVTSVQTSSIVTITPNPENNNGYVVSFAQESDVEQDADDYLIPRGQGTSDTHSSTYTFALDKKGRVSCAQLTSGKITGSRLSVFNATGTPYLYFENQEGTNYDYQARLFLNTSGRLRFQVRRKTKNASSYPTDGWTEPVTLTPTGDINF